MSDRFDAVIIGSGAGGGTLARSLAQTGKRVLLLERGDFIPREPANWDVNAVNAGRYRAKERFIDREGLAFEPFTHYCVGGNTKMYGAALLRLRESDFEHGQVGSMTSPAWPIRYAELEPYYTRAEQLYSVHGARGEDPCDPWASAPYPHAPLAHEPRIAELAHNLTAAGLRPFPIPLGLRLPQDTPGPRAPLSLGPFDGFPDPTESKADAHVVGVNAALAYPNFTLWTGTYAERILTDAPGRTATAVLVRRGNEQLAVHADLIAVACGAIQSAALLLRSANAAHPNGLANGSGLVGRNYMSHNNGALLAYSDVPNPSLFQKTLALSDYYHGAASEARGTIQLMGHSDQLTLQSCFAAALPSVSPEQLAAQTIDFWLTAEDLPDPDNRVTLEPDGTVRLAYRKNNTAAYASLKRELVRKLQQAEPGSGWVFAGYELGVQGVSHQCGTLRFGADPRQSVLDPMCRAHELDNLYVVDASFFCSSGAVNPSLTIMANALRVGDHLVDRLR